MSTRRSDPWTRDNAAERTRRAAVKDMEEIAHLIGLLAGLDASGRIARLLIYLDEVMAGRARTPIALHLTAAEVLPFLQQLAPVMKVAVRLSESAITRTEHPDGDPP